MHNRLNDPEIKREQKENDSKNEFQGIENEIKNDIFSLFSDKL